MTGKKVSYKGLVNMLQEIIDKLKFDEKGLIKAVLQDCETGEVLMVAYMNNEALEKTLETKKAHFWSRSRNELWLKGETSGNYQIVEEVRLDCDGDTLLLKVKSAGPACHTGKKSCFFRRLTGEGIFCDEGEKDKRQAFLEKAIFLKRLAGLIQYRKENPIEGSYTNYLLTEGVDKVCKKIGEEAAEVIIGAKNEDKAEIIYETGDLIYHLLVLLNINEISLEDILNELESRGK